ncbi:hypothetical protein ACFSWE_15335 [Leucobacter albus]|uniref:Uncharacterized protein n=1 Tax=Leucobacter albus TaxID=272210 RepID=A0ABW3TSC9_9MICO
MSGEPRADAGAAEGDELDATIAVAAVDDATIAVAAVDDATIAVAQPGAAHAQPAEPAAKPGVVGAPVEEPEEIPPELAKLLFKNPLDAKRRAPAAPFAKEQSSLPRGGVRSGIPVVYGARGEGFTATTDALDLERVIGAPPAGYAVAVAERELLPSAARLNRKFSVIAWAGAVAVPIVAGVGLWWVLTQLLRP